MQHDKKEEAARHGTARSASPGSWVEGQRGASKGEDDEMEGGRNGEGVRGFVPPRCWRRYRQIERRQRRPSDPHLCRCPSTIFFSSGWRAGFPLPPLPGTICRSGIPCRCFCKDLVPWDTWTLGNHSINAPPLPPASQSAILLVLKLSGKTKPPEKHSLHEPTFVRRSRDGDERFWG